MPDGNSAQDAQPPIRRLFVAGLRLEARTITRSKVFLFLTLLQAVSFLVVVTLFGLTGSMAPTALLNEDPGPLSAAFTNDLMNAHHSFRLVVMSRGQAESELAAGHLVAAITIPPNFSSAIERGETVPLSVEIDNVDADLTDDIQRALPSAIVSFGREQGFRGIRVALDEVDIINHDTAYIPYLIVSALSLDAMVLAGILGGIAVSREFEEGTLRIWRHSPAPAWALLAGKLTAVVIASMVAMLTTVVVVVAVYGIRPLHIWEALAAILASVMIFSAFGAWLGSVIRRTLPLVPLVFGLAIPLYIESGSLEPARFDGEAIWWAAHISPIYYAIGVLQWAFHGLRVTPEPPIVDLGILVFLGIVAMYATLNSIRKAAPR